MFWLGRFTTDTFVAALKVFKLLSKLSKYKKGKMYGKRPNQKFIMVQPHNKMNQLAHFTVITNFMADAKILEKQLPLWVGACNQANTLCQNYRLTHNPTKSTKLSYAAETALNAIMQQI